MSYKIPVYQPSFSGNEKKYVLDCLDSTWISSKGRYIAQFEEAFAAYVKAPYATSVCNGTVALHLAFLTLDIQPGDEVIVPAFTYIASVNAIRYMGAIPVFVESLPDTWQMDPADVWKKITPKTKAVLAVHLYGHPCRMDVLVEICEEHDLYLVEDCAEGLASTFKGQHVGTFGDIASFSFFGNKTITTGEGGMVITKHSDLHHKATHLKNQGVSKTIQYWHDVVGFNYRMTNIAAAIGLAQLEQIDHFVKRKRDIATYYAENIDAARFEFHGEESDVCHSYWMSSILCKNMNRDALMTHLNNNGIETRPLFYPVYKMPPYLNTALSFPIAEKISASGLNLPSYPMLTQNELSFIVATINNLA